MSLQYFNVGKIVNTHGLRGEVKILPLTDFAEQRFAKGSELFMFMPEDVLMQTVTVATARLHKNVYIVKFANFDHINDVEKYKGAMLKVSAEDREELPEHEYYYSEIIGCEVVTDEGERLGKVSEIMSPGANDVWVVKGEGQEEILIPYIEDVVLHVDVEQKVITVHLLEGLREP